MPTFYHDSIPATSGIYKITCTITGRLYVGSASNLRKRRNHHFHQLRLNRHGNTKLQRAFNKYGEAAFVFEVLELVLVRELLTAREQYWFGILKPFGARGFNIDRVAGSCLGVKRSAATRAKMRANRLGKPSPSLGMKKSPEAIERTRQAKIGYHFNAESRAKMSSSQDKVKKTLIVTAPDGTEYLVHGVRQFCREHHLDPSSLMRAAQGRAKGKAYTQHRGYKARFPDAS